MSLSYSITVSGINAAIFWNCSKEDAESVYKGCYDALQEECKRNEVAGLGYNGVVRLVLNGLVAYYHINNLAEKLFKEDKDMNVEKAVFLRKLCNEYKKAFYTSRTMASLFAGMADSVKDFVVQSVLNDVKQYNVAYGVHTGLNATKFVLEDVVDMDSEIFDAESFESAAKELDMFLEITIEAGT